MPFVGFHFLCVKFRYTKFSPPPPPELQNLAFMMCYAGLIFLHYLPSIYMQTLYCSCFVTFIILLFVCKFDLTLIKKPLFKTFQWVCSVQDIAEYNPRSGATLTNDNWGMGEVEEKWGGCNLFQFHLSKYWLMNEAMLKRRISDATSLFCLGLAGKQDELICGILSTACAMISCPSYDSINAGTPFPLFLLNQSLRSYRSA